MIFSVFLHDRRHRGFFNLLCFFLFCQQDQKIIDLMLTRHEEAQSLRKDKMMLDLAWDDQRQLDNDLRQARMKRHQAELYEQCTAKEMKQVGVYT